MGETQATPHLRGKWSISWDGTFLSEVNHNLVVKLNTGCVQNVVTTERGGLGRARLGTDTEGSFFLGSGHTYPHLDEIHDIGYDTSITRTLISKVKNFYIGCLRYKARYELM
jgi:hypothetical protein